MLQPDTRVGTNGSDTFSSIVDEIGSPGTFLNVAGFDFVNFRTLGGDDIVEGAGIINLGNGSSGTTGIGIVASAIDVGTGNDTVTFTGFGNGVAFGSGYGLLRSTVQGRGGQDVITITGTGESGLRTVAKAVGEATVNGGLGDDIITLTSELTPVEGTTPEGLSRAVDSGSKINGNAGEDTISVTARALVAGDYNDFLANRDNPQTSTAVAVSQGAMIQGGLDNDTLTITSRSSAVNAFSTAVDNARVLGGSGDDVIDVSSSSLAFLSSLNLGLTNDSVIYGGQGNDSITVETTAAGPPTALVESIGLKDSAINAGAGNDTIVVTTRNGVNNFSKSTGAENSAIRGGDGDDTIEVIASSGGGNLPSPANGLVDSVVAGGSGNDRITIKASANEPGRDTGYGAQGSKIYGGLGNDTIEVSTNRAGLLDITDTLISGGQGDDTIDAGIGDGTIAGGAGTDTVVLDFLANPLDLITSNTTVSEINGGIQITSELSKSGSFIRGQLSPQWTQTIRSVENFQIGSDVFTASELVATVAASIDAVSG